MDMGSDAGPGDPVYHYHSNYDSYYWMSNFGDPGFLQHKSMGQSVPQRIVLILQCQANHLQIPRPHDLPLGFG
jgi:hypothetical protein